MLFNSRLSTSGTGVGVKRNRSVARGQQFYDGLAGLKMCRQRSVQYKQVFVLVISYLGRELLAGPRTAAREPKLRRAWRRDGDSNPGGAFTPTRFPGVRLKPLGHPSVMGACQLKLRPC